MSAEADFFVLGVHALLIFHATLLLLQIHCALVAVEGEVFE